jgi:hypothetical protein
MKISASHRSTMADGRTESYFPPLKNTEYTMRLDCSVAPLLKQMIHGADEIGLASIGPATSSGTAIFSWLAAVFRSLMEVEITGAGSVFWGISSITDEQAVRTRHGNAFSNCIHLFLVPHNSMTRKGPLPKSNGTIHLVRDGAGRSADHHFKAVRGYTHLINSLSCIWRQTSGWG